MNPTASPSPLSRALLPALVTTLLLASSALASESIVTRRAMPACDGAIQHPIRVRVEALDPIQRGATVRLRVTTRAAVGLSAAEARIVSTGGATVMGRSRAALGRMTPQREAAADFAVGVPASGNRFLVEFRVEGEGATGRIGRGAAFNILPDGPTLPNRTVTAADGRTIAETSARRMP